MPIKISKHQLSASKHLTASELGHCDDKSMTKDDQTTSSDDHEALVIGLQTSVPHQ